MGENHKSVWEEHRGIGERIVERANAELERYRHIGQLTLDDMLAGGFEPVTNENWPGASDMGEYLDRT